MEVAETARAAAADADVLCLCTSAAAQVIALGDCTSDVLITSISTNVGGAHELAPANIARCTVYVDSRAGAPVSASELRPMVERDPGLVVADLAELVTAATPDRPAGPAAFRSVGLGIEDIAIAALLKGPRT